MQPPIHRVQGRRGRMTETELIRRAKGGDETAVRTLYDRYAPRVYAVVRRVAGDDALADDCAQEAWIRVFRALPGFRGDSAFSTWIHRVAVNSALQGLRGRSRHESRETTLLLGEPAAAPEPSAAPEPAALRIALERAMARLPDGMRQVLVLHDVEGFTHDEIGEMMGIAAGTSKSQLFKARAKMRELLAPAGRENERKAYVAFEA
jgi:RNA polymerase sigma-70 factor, ECF subfamily